MNSKKIFPIAIPNISELERKYLNECIDTEFVSSVGPFVDKFEKYLEIKSGFNFASAVSSGTSALSLAIHSLGVKNNDLVIIPDYTFIATANAVAQNQAIPWLIDINTNNLNINFDIVIDEILSNCSFRKGKWHHKETKQELKCVIPVMALGNFIASKQIETFNEKIGLPIIIDAAGALGSYQNDIALGNLDVHAVTISFNGNKTFTCGGGGAVLTNDELFHKKIKHLSTTARSGYEYIHDEPAFNYRMTNIQAAIGCAQLEKYDEFLKTKQYIYDYYKKHIVSKKICFSSCNNSSRWLSYFLAEKLSEIEISGLYKYANQEGILLRPFWVPMHMQPPYKDSISSEVNNSKEIYSKVITLPSSTSLLQEDLKYISKTINNYLKKI